MDGNSQMETPKQRTTLCINESFCFLEYPEYRALETTSEPHITPVKRAVSESGIKDQARNDTFISDHLGKDMKENDEQNIEQSVENCDVNCNIKTDIRGKKQISKSIDNCDDEIVQDDAEILPENEVNKGKTEVTNDTISMSVDEVTIRHRKSKGDNFDKNELATQSDDCDSGCDVNRLSMDIGQRSSVEVFHKETNTCNTHDINVESDSSKVQLEQNCIGDQESENQKVSEQGCIEESESKQNGKTISEETHINTEDLHNRISSDQNMKENGVEDKLQDGKDEEVVQLRPKSTSLPSPRRRTTELVSTMFGFLKEIDVGDERMSQRSSGYKSCDFPLDEGIISKVTNEEGTISKDVKEMKLKDTSENLHRNRSKSLNDKPKEDQKPKMRRQKSHKEVDENLEELSENSSDEDTGIYNESFRNSCWIFLDENNTNHSIMHGSIDEGPEVEPNDTENPDDVFLENKQKNINGLVPNHKRSDSTATTVSEREFKRSFKTRRKCFVQRNDSQQEYERMSCRVFDNEKILTLQKRENESGFGLHILDTQPVIISGVDSESPASRAGVKEGQILLMVNGVSVLEANHDKIISLVQHSTKTLQIEVATTDIHYIRDLQKPVMAGTMYKQKESTFIRTWKRRYCVLRQDHCLYYYKNETDLDPLGAIPLVNYTVSRHLDNSKEHCFKAEKFGAKTYYFSVDNRDDMAKWVGAMNQASMTSKKRKESWMDVTTHNVGLPALEVRKPECSGYLNKCARTTKTWQKRYCVLKDACMYYYKNMYSPRAQGMAHLHGYKIQDGSKKFSFVLRPPEPRMRQFTFAAENETDKNRWVDTLTKSIQRWIRVE